MPRVIIAKAFVSDTIYYRACQPNCIIVPQEKVVSTVPLGDVAQSADVTPSAAVMVRIIQPECPLYMARVAARTVAIGGHTPARPDLPSRYIAPPRPNKNFSVTSWLLKQSKLLKETSPLHVLDRVFEGAAYFHKKYNPRLRDAFMGKEHAGNVLAGYAAQDFVALYFPNEIELDLPNDLPINPNHVKVIP